MKKTIKEIKNDCWNILNNSGAKTRKERTEFIDKLLKENPELAEKAIPKFQGKLVKGNSYSSLMNTFAGWIMKGNNDDPEEDNSKNYYIYEKDIKYVDKKHKTKEEELEEEQRIYNKSNDPEIQRLNSEIRKTREDIAIIDNGGEIIGTDRYHICKRQSELKSQREFIFKNNFFGYEDVDSNVSKGKNIIIEGFDIDDINDAEISLADPEIIKLILAYDKEYLHIKSIELLNLRLDIETILKSMELTEIEELIIKLRVLNITYKKISERVGLSRQIVSKKYNEIINKVAVHFGKIETAKI
ncbi:hypothetical protein [Apilactobacillus timberlakei]|uniref:hypothetical protein n=1 Tax=Apilactobacillus timberlakei TaxID=2008380 RepID=UPI001127A9BB|nr:hypothetical protein [Apilactobacillus timberlakei]TPR12141.1 hypothetical protein DYZ97_07680 [Apilactobacillus timberlakei]